MLLLLPPPPPPLREKTSWRPSKKQPAPVETDRRNNFSPVPLCKNQTDVYQEELRTPAGGGASSSTTPRKLFFFSSEAALFHVRIGMFCMVFDL